MLSGGSAALGNWIHLYLSANIIIPGLNLIQTSIASHHLYNPSSLPTINPRPMNPVSFISEIFNAQNFRQRI